VSKVRDWILTTFNLPDWYVHEKLKADLYNLRESYARLASMNGAGSPGNANCDTELHKKFAALEADYHALERENQSLRVDALVGQQLRALVKLTNVVNL
jgi:hypothetical protein